MKYIDLHTDALTKEGVRSVTAETLERGKCFLQCFACFTPRGGLRDALSLCDKFDEMCASCGFQKVRRAADLGVGVGDGGILALLTLEGGEALEGKEENLVLLHRRGVRMMTLVWNFDNEIGTSHGTKEGFGLTPFGRDVVERMGEIPMIVDVSHGSEKLFSDVAAWSKRTGIPFVASHSDARACFPHTRNLTDGQIRTLADCGGVVGLNFFDGFLSEDRSEEGQRAALMRHARHIVKAGGEDVLALGSDFDGIPENAYMRTAADMPRLFEDFGEIFPPRVVEKIAFRNASRLLRETLQ